MKRVMPIFFVCILFAPLIVSAVDFSSNISASDRATFDQMLTPVMKIYNFVQYAATAIAVVFLVFAGVSFMTSGSDTAKHERAKLTAMYVVIGLIVIWIAPLIVQYITG